MIKTRQEERSLAVHAIQIINQVKHRIDEHVNDYTEWRIEPTYMGNIKWQKDVDIFSFKVYQPVEDERCIPLERRFGIDFRITVMYEGKHVTDIYPPGWPHGERDEQLDKLLKKFDEAKSKKEHIIRVYKQYIESN
jgi:hypothetical protein